MPEIIRDGAVVEDDWGGALYSLDELNALDSIDGEVGVVLEPDQPLVDQDGQDPMAGAFRDTDLANQFAEADRRSGLRPCQGLRRSGGGLRQALDGYGEMDCCKPVPPTPQAAQLVRRRLPP